jgi:hypothetical protein
MKLLTNQSDREEAYASLRELLEARAEWLCSEERPSREAARLPAVGMRAAVCVRRGEWELRLAGGALHFSFWSDAGARVWRVAGWESAGDKLLLAVTRRGGGERARLELVPRASVREAAAGLRAARLAACERLAALACGGEAGAEVLSARLSRGPRRSEPGRYARIVLSLGRRGRVAVTGPLVAVRAHEADAVLASALAWWTRLDEQRAGGKKFEGATRLQLVAGRELSKQLAERLALLREDVRARVSLFETDGSLESLTPVETPTLESLLDAAPRARLPHAPPLTDTAARLVALAPDSVDAIRARRGETLRFHGLPFARVRRLPGGERVWFGPPGARQKLLLGEDNWPRLVKLLDELAEHRRANAPDARHSFYRAAPEAWLESVLRRDITRLDPGLVVSPLHAQFRAPNEPAGARPVDLLALRTDGRLVVVELKVTEDAALPLQGADYWRRISTYHNAGHIRRARLFGDAGISGEPPLVYLVAPLLRFHRDFDTLARMIRPDIEMYRFDLNEDWRAGVRVVRRGRVV